MENSSVEHVAELDTSEKNDFSGSESVEEVSEAIDQPEAVEADTVGEIDDEAVSEPPEDVEKIISWKGRVERANKDVDTVARKLAEASEDLACVKDRVKKIKIVYEDKVSELRDAIAERGQGVLDLADARPTVTADDDDEDDEPDDGADSEAESGSKTGKYAGKNWREVNLCELDGLNASILASLADAEIHTMGDLAVHTTAKRLTDIHMIGPAAAELIDKVTEQFWADWKAEGGEVN